jgi:hypothetical protein
MLTTHHTVLRTLSYVQITRVRTPARALLDLQGLFTLQLSYRKAWTRKDRMASGDEVLITGASFIVMRSLLKTKSRRNRRWWMTSVIRSRDRYSGSHLLCDLRVENLHFRTFCRMSYSDLVGPRISKKDTSFRKAIPVAERLAVTLRFLASGDSFTSLSFLCKMSKETISIIIHFLFHFCHTDVHFFSNFLPRINLFIDKFIKRMGSVP